MKIQFIGGAQTVTGSMHLITVGETRILLECGLFQGRRSDMYEKNQNFPFDPASVDFLLLSHAHIDHSGNIPNLVHRGFQGKILATQPTVDLTKILLKDSAYLQEMDVRWLNKILSKQNKPLLKPLYTTEDAENATKYFHPIDYNQSIELTPQIKATFRDAGHILGSAGILLEINDKGKQHRLGFTGDLGRDHMAVLRDPDPVRDLDILITETTYGGRFHPQAEDIEEQLAQIVNSVAQRGGKIVIPAFAVGRTQQLVYHLHKLFNQDRIPDMPVFVDSPLASKATDVFRHSTEYMDEETRHLFLQQHEDPFGFKRLKYVKSVEESKSLNSVVYPHIIISASGMAEGGRILHHLKNNLGNPKATILFVGYSAKHTLARKIMEGNEVVKVFGEEHHVKASIHVMDCFSAHGDRKDILNYVKYSPPEKLKHIFLVHGEPMQSKSLVDAYRSKGYENIYYPEPMQEFEF